MFLDWWNVIEWSSIQSNSIVWNLNLQIMDGSERNMVKLIPSIPSMEKLICPVLSNYKKYTKNGMESLLHSTPFHLLFRSALVHRSKHSQ